MLQFQKNRFSYIHLIYFGILAVVLFGANTSALWDQDEAAYAGFAKRMHESGNWITTNFTWSRIHRKTPLHFWNIAICYKVFGVNEFAARFSSSFFVFLTYISVFLFGSKLIGVRKAFLAVIVLSTSFFIPLLGKMALTDGTLLFFTTLCGFSILFLLQEKKWKWVLLFWVSFSMALLCKGPPVVIFTGIFIVFSALRHPNWKNLIRLHPWLFLPLALLPVVAWGYATIQYDDGAFLNWMWDWYVLRRINGSVLGQTAPPGTHLLMIIVFFLPWITFIFKSFKTLTQVLIKEKNESFLLASWFISGWLIYELSPSKLPSYAMMAHIPLAFFIAERLDQKLTEGRKYVKYLILGSVLFQIIVWLLVLPNVETIRNTTKRVGQWVEVHAEKESKVYLANNRYNPPSLPFYLERQFAEVSEELNYSVLMRHYYEESPAVFILKESQKELMQVLIPKLKVKAILADTRIALVSDYYIVIKNTDIEQDVKEYIPKENSFIEVPLPKEEYLKQMEASSEWKLAIEAKAKENNNTYETQLDLDAGYMVNTSTAKYKYQLLMYNSGRWRSDLTERAKAKRVSLEDLCKSDLELILKESKGFFD